MREGDLIGGVAIFSVPFTKTAVVVPITISRTFQASIPIGGVAVSQDLPLAPILDNGDRRLFGSVRLDTIHFRLAVFRMNIGCDFNIVRSFQGIQNTSLTSSSRWDRGGVGDPI